MPDTDDGIVKKGLAVLGFPADAAGLVGPLEQAGDVVAECMWNDPERAERMMRRAGQGPPPV